LGLRGFGELAIADQFRVYRGQRCILLAADLQVRQLPSL
jgi:hypothetical protein